MPKPIKQKKQFKFTMDRVALEAHMRCDIYEMDNDMFAKLAVFMYKLKSVQELDDDQLEITATVPIEDLF